MSRKIIFSPILCLLALTLISGCKKKYDEHIGPHYTSVPSDFAIVNNRLDIYNVLNSSGYVSGPSVVSVNLKTNHQFYAAKFNYNVRWNLTISSGLTHAVKVFTGFTDYIDSTNAKWDGASDNEYFFGYTSSSQPDYVTITLNIPGSDIVIRDTMKVLMKKNYHKQTINGIYHYLVDDFDGGNDTTAFSPFYIDAADINGGNTGTPGYSAIKNQANFSYHMTGLDINNNTYIGSCNTPTLNDIKANTFTVTDPHNLFINLYVYGTGKPNTTVSIISYENDAAQAAGVPLDQHINDKFIYQIGVTWKGWKLVSFPYSDFKRPNTGAGLGNNQLNPEKISGFAMELDSYPSSGFDVEAMVDMMVITENGVFQPYEK
ncbi:MAG TPA: hypothetical protein VNB90_05045 [Cytophagaceae bacterium]|nr:hypothetical protein [Cytophagaceae bacterium]